MMFTRTMTTFEAVAYKGAWKGGKLVAEEIGRAMYSGTREDKTAARKAIAEATGKTMPKGCEIVITPVEETVYGMDLEKFLEVAQVIEKRDPKGKDAVNTDDLIG